MTVDGLDDGEALTFLGKEAASAHSLELSMHNLGYLNEGKTTS